MQTFSGLGGTNYRRVAVRELKALGFSDLTHRLRPIPLPLFRETLPNGAARPPRILFETGVIVGDGYFVRARVVKDDGQLFLEVEEDALNRARRRMETLPMTLPLMAEIYRTCGTEFLKMQGRCYSETVGRN